MVAARAQALVIVVHCWLYIEHPHSPLVWAKKYKPVHQAWCVPRRGLWRTNGLTQGSSAAIKQERMVTLIQIKARTPCFTNTI